MKRVSIGLLVLLMVCRNLAYPQGRVPHGDLSCMSSLELPTHGLLAARASSSGTVKASLQVGPRGSLSKTTFTSDDPILEREVQIALGLSVFGKRCAGRTLEVVFSFLLQDPPRYLTLPPAVGLFHQTNSSWNFHELSRT